MQGSKRDTDVRNRLLDYVGEGKGGMLWENSTEACISPYVKQMTSASSTHEAEHSKPVLWDNQRDGVGSGGRGFRTGGHMCTHGWFMSMYGQNHSIVIILHLIYYLKKISAGFLVDIDKLILKFILKK